ncbi:Transcriptional regulator, MarR family [Burkholderia sp. IT-111MI5]
MLHRGGAARRRDRAPEARRMADRRRAGRTHGCDAEDSFGLRARPRPEPDRDLRVDLTGGGRPVAPLRRIDQSGRESTGTMRAASQSFAESGQARAAPADSG